MKLPILRPRRVLARLTVLFARIVTSFAVPVFLVDEYVLEVEVEVEEVSNA
jgi:hypothetical protein